MLNHDNLLTLCSPHMQGTSPPPVITGPSSLPHTSPDRFRGCGDGIRTLWSSAPWSRAGRPTVRVLSSGKPHFVTFSFILEKIKEMIASYTCTCTYSGGSRKKERGFQTNEHAARVVLSLLACSTKFFGDHFRSHVVQ